jgi:hypothetical protein
MSETEEILTQEEIDLFVKKLGIDEISQAHAHGLINMQTVQMMVAAFNLGAHAERAGDL